MAFTYGFYNSLRGDRKYNAEQVSEIFDGILKDGIIPSQGQLFDVNTASNGMQITVGTGRAWFNHTWSKNDSVMVLTVPQSDITRDRYDAVVLEVNHEDSVRANAIKIESGVPAVNPVKPTLLNTDKVKQYPLAYILVKAGTETILAENIENMVGRTPTVFATGVLETVAIDDLWSQWEGEWHTWFESIKLQLSGDIVTNLQYQIDQLRTYTELSSEILSEYNLPDDANFTDIFDNIYKRFRMIMLNKALMTLTVKLNTGEPAVGFTISAVTTENGQPTVTDENGRVVGFISEGSIKISITGYADIADFSQTFSIVKGETYSKTITLTTRNYLLITATQNVMFSPAVKSVSYSVCGAGGGGAASSLYGGCGGGGGGNCVSVTNKSVTPNYSYSAKVGAGGYGGGTQMNGTYTAGPGGESSFLGTTATGGGAGQPGSYSNGVAGGGAGGSSSNGVGGTGAKEDSSYATAVSPGTSGGNGTKKFYNSYTTEITVGGGGGSGAVQYTYKTGYSGGSPYGGRGGDSSRNSGVIAGSSGTGYGGGGGGCGGGGASSSNPATGGGGYQGAIGIRMYF